MNGRKICHYFMTEFWRKPELSLYFFHNFLIFILLFQNFRYIQNSYIMFLTGRTTKNEGIKVWHMNTALRTM